MTGVVADPPRLRTVDAENPWPGLAAFEESDASFFHGRDAAIEALLQIIRREDLVLLYGSSGLGKTSLVRAGLFPRLPATLLPVYVRLHYGRPATGLGDASDLRRQVLDAVIREAERRGVEPPPPAASGTLWEFFRRRDQPFWGPGNEIVLPLLVFDQFEQLFTRDPAASLPTPDIEMFLDDLGDLVNGRVPEWLGARAPSAEAAERFIFETPGCKVLFSFREDFLADVKRLDSLIPSTDQNWYRLEPMRWMDAVRAVRASGAHILAPLPPGSSEGDPSDVAAAIALQVSGTTASGDQRSVDPGILSLFCTELNEERKERARRGESPRIDHALVQSRQSAEIIARFYRRAVRDVPPEVRHFIETRLILPSGARNSVAMEEVAALPEDAIRTLIDTWRILRPEVVGRQRQTRLELTHDVLVKPVIEDRRRREDLEAREREIASRVQAERDKREAIERRLDQERAELARARDLLVLRTRIVRIQRWALLAIGVLAVLAIGLFAFAVNKQRESDALRSDAAARLTDQEVVGSSETARTGRTAEGLAHLAALMRQNPGNATARALSIDLLLRHTWFVPTAETSGDGPALWADLDPTGTVVVTAWASGVARLWRAATGEAIVDLRHEGAIWTASFDGSGRWLVTASQDGSARVWDAATGARVATLPHGGPVFAALFSPDGRFLVTAGADDTAVVWAATTWERQRELRHAGPVVAAQVSPDSTRVLTASLDGTARLWEPATGRQVGRDFDHRSPVEAGTTGVGGTDGASGRVLSATFSPDGRLVATADDAGSVRVWRSDDQSCLGTAVHDGPVLGLQFRPGQAAASLMTTQGRVARVWDLPEAGGCRPLTPSLDLRHQGEIRTAFFSADGGLLLTAAADGLARIWDASTGEQATAPLSHPFPLSSARFDGTGRRVVSAAEDGHSTAWALASTPAAPLTLTTDARVLVALFTPDGRQVVAGARDGTARIWNATTGTLDQTLTHDPTAGGGVTPIDVGPGGRLLTVFDQTVYLWRRQGEQWAPGPRTARAADAVFSARFDPKGGRVITACGDGSVQIWNADTGEPEGRAIQVGARVWSAEFNGDGSRIVTASANGTAQVWDAATGAAVGPPLTHEGEVFSARFAPGGAQVVTGAADGKAAVWPVGAPAWSYVLQHSGPVVWAQFSPDGRRVITAAEDGTLQIWDTAARRTIARLRAHGQRIAAGHLSADGLRVATGSTDGTFRVWDGLSGQPHALPFDVHAPVNLVRFNPAGSRVVVATDDRFVQIVDVPRSDQADVPWIASTIEAVGGAVLDTRSQLIGPLPDRLPQLARLRAATTSVADGSDPPLRERLLGWFFSPPDARPLSPFTTAGASTGGRGVDVNASDRDPKEP